MKKHRGQRTKGNVDTYLKKYSNFQTLLEPMNFNRVKILFSSQASLLGFCRSAWLKSGTMHSTDPLCSNLSSSCYHGSEKSARSIFIQHSISKDAYFVLHWCINDRNIKLCRFMTTFRHKHGIAHESSSIHFIMLYNTIVWKSQRFSFGRDAITMKGIWYLRSPVYAPDGS